MKLGMHVGNILLFFFSLVPLQNKAKNKVGFVLLRMLHISNQL